MIKGSIYCITNMLNNKKYIGKTLDSLEKRFNEHIRDSRRERCEKRPLYDAFNKHGIENFKIELVEECSYELLSNREIYWIQKLDTYSNGYNATLGGDGRVLYNYEEILQKFQDGMLIKDLAKYFECGQDTISKIIKNSDENTFSNSIAKSSKEIYQYSKDNVFIQKFSSRMDAARYLVEQGIIPELNTGIVSHISAVVKGTRKTAYGFVWKNE